MNLLERFESQVLRRPDGCWIWTGGQKYGYGRVMLAGIRMFAHRWAYVLYRGEIPEGLCVCHRCDVPLCVNPEHLFLGTQTDNVADMDAKGRRVPPKGERNANAKLTADQVLQVRLDSRPMRKIAREYGVTNILIRKIKKREVWRHLA